MTCLKLPNKLPCCVLYSELKPLNKDLLTTLSQGYQDSLIFADIVQALFVLLSEQTHLYVFFVFCF